MTKINVDSKINLNIDTEKMMDVPDEKIEQVIGQIICRFARWKCDELSILSEGHNNLYCQFWQEGKVKLVMGAIWRTENQEFTFHT